MQQSAAQKNARTNMARAFSERNRQTNTARTEYFDIMPRGYHP